MIDKLSDSDPVGGVLLEALIKKVSGLCGDINIGGYFDLILDDFD